MPLPLFQFLSDTGRDKEPKPFSSSTLRWLCIALLTVSTTQLQAQGTTQAPESSGDQDKTLTWYVYDLPPISIVGGSDESKGVNNQVLSRLISGLPMYRHQTKSANFPRIVEAIRAGEHAASVGFQKTPEREKVMSFSVPFTIALSPRAIVLKSRLASIKKYLNSDGELSLEKVLTDTPLKVGLASGRSYLSGINSVIESHKDSPQLVRRAAADMSDGLMSMLRANRFDLTIMFVEEALYQARALEGKVEIVSLPIKESPEYATIHVAVPKGPWGDALLSELNPKILKFRDTTAYHREREFWMDEGARKTYRGYSRNIKW